MYNKASRNFTDLYRLFRLYVPNPPTLTEKTKTTHTTYSLQIYELVYGYLSSLDLNFLLNAQVPSFPLKL